MANQNIGSKCRICIKLIYDKQCNAQCCECLNIFHIRCSQYKVKDFEKLRLNTDFKFVCSYCISCKCEKCSKPIFNNDNKLQCEASDCKKWYHLKCTPISLKDLNSHKMMNTEISWSCKDCINFPFSTLNEKNFKTMVTQDDKTERKISKLLEDGLVCDPHCSVCKRKIVKNKLKKGLYCRSCKHIIHRKCSHIPLTELNSSKSNHLDNWECLPCMKIKFPFTDIDLDIVLEQTFNSNFDCKCQTSCSSLTRDHVFSYSKYVSSLEEKNYGPDAQNQIDRNMDLQTNFDYYIPHDFHKLIKKLPTPNKHFSLLHTNICSLKQNFENLEDLIINHDHVFDVIALSETWNSEEKKQHFKAGSLQGYHNFIGCTSTTIKGGCGFYIKDTLKYVERKDLDVQFYDVNNEFQGKWIEIINEKIKTVVGVYYRHPKKSSNDTFLKYLKINLDKIKRENKIFIITGDFNYDLLTMEKNEYTYDFINTMYSNFLIPCIKEASRAIINNRPTLIDNIFVNVIDKEIRSGNLVAKISDHRPNFIVINHFIHRKKLTKKYYRDFKNFDENSYLADLSKISVNELNYGSINEIYNHFHNEFKIIIINNPQ